MTINIAALPIADALVRWVALGRQGVTVSVCYGPSGAKGCRWTVDVLTTHGQSFARPFAAESLGHAIAIADHEVRRRGWLIGAENSR